MYFNYLPRIFRETLVFNPWCGCFSSSAKSALKKTSAGSSADRVPNSTIQGLQYKNKCEANEKTKSLNDLYGSDADHKEIQFNTGQYRSCTANSATFNLISCTCAFRGGRFGTITSAELPRNLPRISQTVCLKFL